MMVDPPAGWRYGFPRFYDKDQDGDLGEWLVKGGYPREDVDFALRYTRFFSRDSQDEQV